MPVSIIIPTLNEAVALPGVLESIAALDPPPIEVIIADANSTDGTRTLADEFGVKCITGLQKNRAAQMNAGAKMAQGDILAFLHADARLPVDYIALSESILSEQKTGLAGFVSIMKGKQVRRITTTHNFIKTWYAPILFRPISFLKGCRLLFGDQAIICRREDFEAVGGYDEKQVIMEEAALCLAIVRGKRGRVRQVNRKVWSSDRRVAAWGFWRANLTYFYVGIMWGLGRNPERLKRAYEDVR